MDEHFKAKTGSKKRKKEALSYEPKDCYTIGEIAKKWMEQMGIRNTQYIIARHHETEYPHWHIVFNRIDNDDNLISDSNERILNTKVCCVLTKKYKLYFTPKNSKARNKSRLRPHQLRKFNLRSSTLDVLAVSRSRHDFFRMLKEKRREENRCTF